MAMSRSVAGTVSGALFALALTSFAISVIEPGFQGIAIGATLLGGAAAVVIGWQSRRVHHPTIAVYGDDIKALLAARLGRYREYPYEQLAALVGSYEVEELKGADATPYELEFQFFWDDKPTGNVRVIGGIDGGSLSTSRPLTDSFIMAPDGAFVGEQQPT
jgi:hypothetical protein